MHRKASDLTSAFVGRRMGRRELVRRMGQLGLGAAAANFLLNRASTRALAADFDWKAHQGTSLQLLMNKHPYMDAMVANLDNFKELTGMDVKYDVFPEDVYFDKVTATLSSGSSQYDAFMTGAYQTWQYGPAGWLVDMAELINDAELTAPNYNWEDILPNLRASTAWSGVPGAPLGGDGAKQWAIPWGFELNSLSYNRRIFEQAGIANPPKDLAELMEQAAKITDDVPDVYGIGVRGSRSWATIHPGYLSGFSNYGARDFNVDNGKLTAAMNSDAGKTFTRQWVEMIQQSGPKNWSTYTWYQVGTDLGAGASGMIYDADILGYFQNGGTPEAGNIAYSAFAPNSEADAPTPNVWIWSLGMNANGEQQDAAWYFVQWASGTEHGLFGAREMDFVNPVRQSVWDDEAFRDRIAKSYPGYLEQYEASAPGSKIYFTPQPLFFNLTTEWAASLQRMVANEVPVDEGLDQLAESVNGQLKSAGLG
jgi:multiple sugar transport system substrate-binding protein